MNCQVIKTTKVAGGWQKSPPTCTWCFWLASLLDCSSVSLVKGAKIHHVCILTNFLTTPCWQFTGLLILIRSDFSRSTYEANRAFWAPSFPCLLSWQKNWVIKSRRESVCVPLFLVFPKLDSCRRNHILNTSVCLFRDKNHSIPVSLLQPLILSRNKC